MTTITLSNGETRPYPARGRYLYVVSATGPVTVRAILADGTSDTNTFNSREGMRFDADMTELEIMNAHTTTNVVVFMTTIGEYRPSNDGTKVILTGQDVQIQTVSADLGNTADAAAGSDTGTGSLIALFKRLLGKLPSSIGQKVKANSLSVTLASDQGAVLVDRVVATALVAGAVITNSGTIPANPNRKRVGVKALKTNTGIGWTHSAANGGDALEAGDRVIFNTTDAIDITATVGTDKFAWWEEE